MRTKWCLVETLENSSVLGNQIKGKRKGINMKTLMYEDVNLETGFSYSVYRFSGLSGTSYLIYECNNDGCMKYIREFISYDNAIAYVKCKCK